MLLSLFSQETCLCIQIDQVVQSFSQVIAAPRALLHLLPLLPPPESRCTSHQSGTVTSANTDSASVLGGGAKEALQRSEILISWRRVSPNFHFARLWCFLGETHGNTDEWRSYIKLQYKDFRLILQYISWFLRLVAGCIFFHSAHSKATADRNVCPHQRLLAAWWSNTLTLT